MANAGLKPVAGFLLMLNFCMYLIVAAVGGWAINFAINNGFFIGTYCSLLVHNPGALSCREQALIRGVLRAYVSCVNSLGRADVCCYTGSGLELPSHFSPIYFPIGNAATGFFVIFAVIASVVGMGAALAGFHHVRAWSHESLPAAASSAFIAWMLTLLAMGYVVV